LDEESTLSLPYSSTSDEEKKIFSDEENAEDIFVLETYFFGSPSYDEEVISNTNQKQGFFMNIPAKIMKSRSFSWFLWNLVAWFLYMMIMNMILGRSMKEKRKI